MIKLNTTQIYPRQPGAHPLVHAGDAVMRFTAPRISTRKKRRASMSPAELRDAAGRSQLLELIPQWIVDGLVGVGRAAAEVIGRE